MSAARSWRWPRTLTGRDGTSNRSAPVSLRANTASRISTAHSPTSGGTWQRFGSVGGKQTRTTIGDAQAGAQFRPCSGCLRLGCPPQQRFLESAGAWSHGHGTAHGHDDIALAGCTVLQHERGRCGNHGAPVGSGYRLVDQQLKPHVLRSWDRDLRTNPSKPGRKKYQNTSAIDGTAVRTNVFTTSSQGLMGVASRPTSSAPPPQDARS